MGLWAVRCRPVEDVDGCGASGVRIRQLGSHELLSLLSNLLHKHEVKLALIGSAHGDGGPLEIELLLAAGGMLGSIELETRFDRDLIGDSVEEDFTGDSVSISSCATTGLTVAIVELSLSVRFFTILWILSISCFVKV